MAYGGMKKDKDRNNLITFVAPSPSLVVALTRFQLKWGGLSADTVCHPVTSRRPPNKRSALGVLIGNLYRWCVGRGVGIVVLYNNRLARIGTAGSAAPVNSYTFLCSRISALSVLSWRPGQSVDCQKSWFWELRAKVAWLGL